MRRLIALCAALQPVVYCQWQDALAPAGPDAERISGLWWLNFWVCAAVYILVLAGFLVAAMRKRNVVSETSMLRSVGGATAITVLLLFVLLIASFITGRALAGFRNNDPVMIQLIGHQWWWEVRYLDPIASQHLITANEIHIPVGRPVRFELTSRDVIHSFWVPNLHGKRDLIPGKVNETWVQADREGLFRGQCAEYCGWQHAHMAMIVIAEAPEAFAAWLDSQRKPGRAPDTLARTRGQQVFLNSSCVTCHTVRGTDAGAQVAPDLTHVGSRKTIAAGTLINTRANLAAWIVDSQKSKPGNYMPQHNLASADVDALVSYIESLQ